MAYTGSDLKGLGLFGQRIVQLIDEGKTEAVDLISDKMYKKALVSYISDKYPSPINFRDYNIEALDDFFYQNSPVVEKSGVDRPENGLLVILSVILNELEYKITSW